MNATEVYAILKKKIAELGITQEEIEKAVALYLDEHGIKVNTDKSLEKTDVPADSKATGDALRTKADGKGIAFSVDNAGALTVSYDDGR